MTDFNLADIQKPLADLPTTLEKVARTGLGLYCQVSRWQGENLPTIGFARQVNPIGQAIYERMCGPITPQQPRLPEPVIPFTGGQCVGVNYRVNWQVRNSTIGGQPEWFNSTNVIFGPLAFGSRRLSNPRRTQQFISGRTSNGQPAEIFLTNINDVLGAGQQAEVIRNLAVVRVDGQPDTCGNTGGGGIQPTTNPTPYPGPTIDIPNPGPSGGPLSLPWRIPAIQLPIPFKGPFVEVTIGPFNITIGPNTINVSPTINLPGFPQIGPGFDPEGPNDSNPEQIAESLEEIKKTLARIEACSCCPSLQPVRQVITSANSQIVPLNSSTRVAFVLVDITSDPVNPKRQEGGNAPDVLYAGWVWFSGQVGLGERMPIDAFTKLFEVPCWARNFCFTLYTGYNANVSFFDEVEVSDG